MQIKKNTVRRRISNRNYALLLNFFETGQSEVDLSAIDSSVLDQVHLRVMRLSKEDKEKMDEFLSTKSEIQSLASFLATIQTNKKGE